MNSFLYYMHLVFPKLAERAYRTYIKTRLGSPNFTIISNNCWGGGIYEELEIEFTSPTVGLFFYAPCYLNFITDLKKYIELTSFTFITHSKYEEANQLRQDRNWFYPIARLDDIEIHFMHYKTEAECIEKWNRRKKRINWEQLYFKMCDRDLCTPEIRNAFLNLRVKNKVFFGARDVKHPHYIFLKAFQKEKMVPSLYEHPWFYRKQFNFVKWINSGKV
jgi:uncharacterized protein (DUF1919 family)